VRSSLLIPRPPTSTLFPYTTLFRSLIGDSRHVTAEVVTHLLPAAIRHRLRLLGLALMALFCAMLGWLGWELTQLAIAVDERGERSEEHTSELQSRENLVCRLLLEKK